MTKRLTLRHILRLNEDVVGLDAEIVEAGGLRSLIDHAFSTVGEVDLYETVFLKAAVLGRGVARGGYFRRGNLETGYLAAVTLLDVNGVLLRDVSLDEYQQFLAMLTTEGLDLSDASLWLVDRTSLGH